MAEFWDIYDINRNKTGRLAERNVYCFKDGEYCLVVVAVIINSKGEILITKRSPNKIHEPSKWELTGGGAQAGETSLQAILRETREEIGLKFKPEDVIFLKEIRKDKRVCNFKDLWLFKTDIPIKDIKFTDGEVSEAKWVTIDELLKMKENNELISTMDFGIEEYELALQKGLTLK